MRLEHCCHCDEPTGRAGEDSLTLQGAGPFCEHCYDVLSAGQAGIVAQDLELIGRTRDRETKVLLCSLFVERHGENVTLQLQEAHAEIVRLRRRAMVGEK